MWCVVLNVKRMQMDVSFWKVSTKTLPNISAGGGGEEFVYNYRCYASLNSVLFKVLRAPNIL